MRHATLALNRLPAVPAGPALPFVHQSFSFQHASFCTSATVSNAKLLPPKSSVKGPAAVQTAVTGAYHLLKYAQNHGGSIIAIDTEGKPEKPTELGFSSKTFSAHDPSFTKSRSESYALNGGNSNGGSGKKGAAAQQASDVFIHGPICRVDSFQDMTNQLQKHLSELPKPLIVVLHAANQDTSTLAKHSIDMTQWNPVGDISVKDLSAGRKKPPSVSLVDTSELSVMFSKNRGQMSLEDLAVMFGKRTQNSAVKLHNAGNDAHLTLQCFEAMLIIPQPSELEETVQNLAETYTTLNNQLSQKLVEYKNVSTGLEQLKRRAETLTTDIGKAKDRQQQLDKVMKENKLQLSKTIQRLDEIKNFVKQYGPLLAATSTAGDQKQDNAAKNSPAPSTSEEQNPSGTQKNVPSQTSPPSSTSQSATGDSATIAALEAQIDADTGSKMDSDPEKSDPVSETSASSSSSQVATLETQTDADVEFKKDDDSEKGDSVTTSSCEDQSGEEDSK